MKPSVILSFLLFISKIDQIHDYVVCFKLM